MTRPSRRVVEEAALICQVAASNSRLDWYLVGDLGVSDEAYSLAIEACRYTVSAYRRIDGNTQTRAEAEALLRCGWLPGQKGQP